MTVPLELRRALVGDCLRNIGATCAHPPQFPSPLWLGIFVVGWCSFYPRRCRGLLAETPNGVYIYRLESILPPGVAGGYSRKPLTGFISAAAGGYWGNPDALTKPTP